MIRYRELTPDLRGGVSWRLLRFFGAGAIIASVTIGSGETLFASKGGAIFGYALLWCFVISAVTKGVQVYGAARYMTLTGQHPMTHWAALPGPPRWVPIVIGILSIVCFPFYLSGLPLMIGKTMNWILQTQVSDENALFYARCWGTFFILLAVGLSLLQSYRLLEKVQTAVVGVLLASVVAACFVSGPDWLAFGRGLFVPSVPDYPEWMRQSTDASIKEIVAESPWVWVGLFLGAVGGGTYDYIGYVGCLREKKWGAIGTPEADQAFDPKELQIDIEDENVKRGLRWLLPAKIDVGVGFGCVLFFTVCFVILGAEILGPDRLIPSGHELLTHQAKFLTQFHPAMLYVYQVGIFAAFSGTIYGAYEVYSRTAYECVVPLSRRVRDVSPRIVRRLTTAYCGIGGLFLLWVMDDPERIIMPAAIVGGVFTCGLWCFAMLWVDRHFLPKPLQMKTALTLMTLFSGIVLTGIGAKSLWDYVVSLVGG